MPPGRPSKGLGVLGGRSLSVVYPWQSKVRPPPSSVSPLRLYACLLAPALLARLVLPEGQD